MEGYNSVMGDILMKYPVTNNSQWKYECVYGITSYITSYNDVGYDSLLEQRYAGIRGIFVRHSLYDDNEAHYRYNNVDPWFRKFKAYTNGNKINYVKQFVCEPIFENSFNVTPKAYVLTTSIEGSMIYCLDVIEYIK